MGLSVCVCACVFVCVYVCVCVCLFVWNSVQGILHVSIWLCVCARTIARGFVWEGYDLKEPHLKIAIESDKV